MTKLLTALCVALTACMVFAAGAFAAEVAVVNVDTLFAKGAPAMAARKHLEQVQAVLQQGYDKLAAIHKGNEKDPEVQAIMIQAERSLNMQLAAERQAVDGELGRLVAVAVDAWRKANPKNDLVLSNRLTLGFGDGVDITAAVQKEFDKLTPKFPPLPTVTVENPKKGK